MIFKLFKNHQFMSYINYTKIGPHNTIKKALKGFICIFLISFSFSDI